MKLKKDSTRRAFYEWQFCATVKLNAWGAAERECKILKWNDTRNKNVMDKWQMRKFKIRNRCI